MNLTFSFYLGNHTTFLTVHKFINLGNIVNMRLNQSNDYALGFVLFSLWMFWFWPRFYFITYTQFVFMSRYCLSIIANHPKKNYVQTASSHLEITLSTNRQKITEFLYTARAVLFLFSFTLAVCAVFQGLFRLYPAPLSYPMQ